jgi:hypothetical protein
MFGGYFFYKKGNHIPSSTKCASRIVRSMSSRDHPYIVQTSPKGSLRYYKAHQVFMGGDWNAS